MTDFFSCYLLRSEHPNYEGYAYIGFTNNPKRRIRQHNGEIANGAKRTKGRRPWKMSLFISGFSSKVAALQFEWAWTYPHRSKKLKDHLKVPRGSGPRYCFTNKLYVLSVMLEVDPWCSQPLNLVFLEDRPMEAFRLDALSPGIRRVRRDLADMRDTSFAHCHLSEEALELNEYQPPGPADSWDDFTGGICGLDEGEDCVICMDTIETGMSGCCTECNTRTHLRCLALWMLRDNPDDLIPKEGSCPGCRTKLSWAEVVRKARELTAGRATAMQKLAAQAKEKTTSKGLQQEPPATPSLVKTSTSQSEQDKENTPNTRIMLAMESLPSVRER